MNKGGSKGRLAAARSSHEKTGRGGGGLTRYITMSECTYKAEYCLRQLVQGREYPHQFPTVSSKAMQAFTTTE